MPLVHSRLSQNMQFTWVTHLFLKLALDVDIVVPASTDERPLSSCPPTVCATKEKKEKKKKIVVIVSYPPFRRAEVGRPDRAFTLKALRL